MRYWAHDASSKKTEKTYVLIQLLMNRKYMFLTPFLIDNFFIDDLDPRAKTSATIVSWCASLCQWAETRNKQGVSSASYAVIIASRGVICQLPKLISVLYKLNHEGVANNNCLGHILVHWNCLSSLDLSPSPHWLGELGIIFPFFTWSTRCWFSPLGAYVSPDHRTCGNSV